MYNSGLLIILIPLIIGYLIPIKNKKINNSIKSLLNGLVYIILLLMGINLAFLDNIADNLLIITRYTAIFFTCTFGCNLLALAVLNRYLPEKFSTSARSNSNLSRFGMIFDSLQLCGVVIIGFLLGLTHWSLLSHALQFSEIALLILLFLVGIQLRNSGLSLRQIILNFRGALIAGSVLISTLLGGVLAALILQLPLNTGMAVASGFGWYSLSASMLTKSLGPLLGSTAFFNDLTRELVAIIMIPFLMRHSSSQAIGICGATSMDFTLPVLQRVGGIAIVPIAIVNGFLLSLCAPILMAFLA